MEQLQNFGPDDAHNGTLAQMFRNAGISDMQSYVDEVREENKSGLSKVKQVYKTYKSLDKNDDGKITVEDLEILLKEMGFGFVSKHLARAIFDLVDANHNGQLDFHDLIVLASILKRLSSSSSSASVRL